jgi:hypothetical protein
MVPKGEVPIYCSIMVRVQWNEMQVRRLVGTQPLDMDLSSTQLDQKIASSFRVMARSQLFLGECAFWKHWKVLAS